ncbi:MAG: hypothetical protein IT328_04605 [Caldilineaceae bacterium]|nr:hypothetical protein [Caldilineaceae bacterium]
MPDMSGYLSESQPAAIGELIALKPTSITVVRGSTTLSPQTVRLETLSSQRQIQGANNVIHVIDAMALGYRNHPTQDDTDLKAGDRFFVDGTAFEVVVVMPAHVDCLQAYLKVRA